MANHKQAEKRNRQRLKRRSRNLTWLSPMRTYIKRVRAALAAGELDGAQTALPLALRAIAKAKQNGVIHGNTASRYTARLTVAVQKAANG